MGAGSDEMRVKLKTINQARKLYGVEGDRAEAKESRREQSAEMDKRGRKLERVRKSVGKSTTRVKREKERERESEGRRQVEIYEYLRR